MSKQLTFLWKVEGEGGENNTYVSTLLQCKGESAL